MAARAACACVVWALGCADDGAVPGDAVDADGAGIDADGDGDAPSSDVGTDTTPVLRDTSEVETSLACPSALAADVVVGRDDARWCFEALAADTSLEIVHGIQGGIHVELRVALRGGTSAPTIGLEVELTHDGTALARFASTLVGLQPLGNPAIPPDVDGSSASWATAAFPVVFANVDASLYAGLDAEVHARVTIDGAPVELTPVPVNLVDPAIPP